MPVEKFKMELTNTDGGRSSLELDAVTFEEVIGSRRYKFAVHESMRTAGDLTVSHFASGMRACEISFDERCASSDHEELGRRALAKLIQNKGVARVASVLFHAENNAK